MDQTENYENNGEDCKMKSENNEISVSVINAIYASNKPPHTSHQCSDGILLFKY